MAMRDDSTEFLITLGKQILNCQINKLNVSFYILAPTPYLDTTHVS
jgi:hypothetical protein